MGSDFISVESLDVTIAGKPILRDVSFQLDHGEYVSIIGPNGAGKTTLLKCLNRIVATTSGLIRFDQKPLREYRQRDLAKVLSYVPQADARYLPFSVMDFVLMGRYPHLSPFSAISAADKKAAQECLELTGMAAFAERAMDTLSGGERQAAFIAAALAQGARTLLLDEPTTFLDYKHQLEVQALLAKLHRDEQLTILAVTHDVTSAIWSSTRVLALKEGRLVFDGSPEALTAADTLEQIYGTPMRLVHDAGLSGPLVVPVANQR